MASLENVVFARPLDTDTRWGQQYMRVFAKLELR